jgi:hypothetical protein
MQQTWTQKWSLQCSEEQQNNSSNFQTTQLGPAAVTHVELVTKQPGPKIVAVQQLPLEESNKLPASLPRGPLTVAMCA